MNQTRNNFSQEVESIILDQYHNAIFQGEGEWYESFEGVIAVLNMLNGIGNDNNIFNKVKEKEEYNSLSDEEKNELIDQNLTLRKDILKGIRLEKILRNEIENLEYKKEELEEQQVPENEINDQMYNIINEIKERYLPYWEFIYEEVGERSGIQNNIDNYIRLYLPEGIQYQHPVGGNKRIKKRKTKKAKRKSKKTRKNKNRNRK